MLRWGDAGIAAPVTEPAPAKVNLALAVLGRRPDGYHDIDSVMHSLELADRVTVAPGSAPGVRVACDHPAIPCAPDENLGARAAARLAELLGVPLALEIQIESRIPVAAGLGAGSAVAAAVLRACCRLWGVDPRDPAVFAAARATGADVPFCLRGGAARAQGVGDRLTPLPAWPGLPVVLVAFPFPVRSAWAYEAYDRWPVAPRVDVEAAAEALLRRDAAALGRALANALEPVTAARHPEVAAAREALLRAGALGAAMSGSGPTVFGLFEEEEGARAAAERLRGQGYAARATRLGAPLTWPGGEGVRA